MRIIIMIIMSFILVGCAMPLKETDAPEKENTKEEKEVIEVNPKIKIDSAVDVFNENHQSELLVAVHNDDVDLAISLIDKGANVNAQDNILDSPYLYAGAQGHLEILDYMLKFADIDFTVVNRFGGNTLIPAAEKGHLKTVIRLLKDDRIDVDFQNNFGYTALIEAVALTDGSEVFVNIIKALLDAGANKDLRDNYGKTALDYAKELGYSEIEEILK